MYRQQSSKSTGTPTLQAAQEEPLLIQAIPAAWRIGIRWVRRAPALLLLLLLLLVCAGPAATGAAQLPRPCRPGVAARRP